MNEPAPTLAIERLSLPLADADVRDLARLLVDTIESGSAVSFLAGFSTREAESWWRHTIENADPAAVFLVARDPDGIVGTVQLHPAWAPNQPHRAEVAKLIVGRRARRSGLGTRLMMAIEAAAKHAGFALLTLDTKAGDTADRLYRRLGWIVVGTIPGYALDPDGTPHDATLFYKPVRLDSRA